jgi:hypothetical protein
LSRSSDDDDDDDNDAGAPPYDEIDEIPMHFCLAIPMRNIWILI